MAESVRQMILIRSDSAQLNRQLNKPIGSSKRIRYTCATACDLKLVCGASSGSLYLFELTRTEDEPGSCVQFERKILYNEGPVSAISLVRQADCWYLAFGTANGSLILLQQYESDGVAWRELTVCSRFAERTISSLALCANKAGDVSVYFACDDHSVYVFERLQSVSQLLFRPSVPSRLLKLDSKVHQLHVWQSHVLLVAADERSLLLDLVDIGLTQLGSRPRPSGHFGACFYSVEAKANASKCVFSARPGLRLWQVNVQGQVLVTHQFKSFVNSNESSGCVLSATDHELVDPFDITQLKGWSNAYFQSLHVIHFKQTQFLLTYTNG
jgi:hypothetical protein